MRNLEKVFQAHLEQLNENYLEAGILLGEVSESIMATKALPEVAVWLWAVMEQVERTKGLAILESYNTKVNDFIDFLITQWNQGSENIWGEDHDLIHISNLGMVYGALGGSMRVLGRGSLQRTLTGIRDYVFNHGLSGGMLIRSYSKKEVSADLLVTVMPFGLFSPEDLVMVEAVKEIENRLVSRTAVYPYRGAREASVTSAAWLAWYFVEKGDIKKAKSYLQLTEEILAEKEGEVDKKGRDDSLARIIVRIVEFYLKQIQGLTQEIQIIHTPYGNDNPYEFQSTERVPRDPEINQEVKVRAKVYPDGNGITVYVQVQTSSKEFIEVCTLKTINGENIWEASLGEFDSEEVHYAFIVKKDNKEVSRSTSFTFYPLAINIVSSVQLVGFKENTIWLKGMDTLDFHPVYFGLSSDGEDIRIEVDFNPIDISSQDKENQTRLCVIQNEDRVSISSSKWMMKINLAPFHFQITDQTGEKIYLKAYEELLPTFQWWTNIKGEINKATWNLKSPLEERFFGFGERYNHLEQRGNLLDNYVYNQYRDQGNRTYMPVPFYISSKGYGLFLESNYYSVIDLGSEFQNLLHLSTNLDWNTSSFAIHLLLGNPKEVNRKFASISGKPVLPPVWAFGPWMSSNNWDRDSIVRKQVEETNRYQIPATVLVIEQWSDEATFYIFNDAEYPLTSGNSYLQYSDFNYPDWGRWPDPKGLMDYLHDQGLRVLLWQIPVQKYLNRQTHPQKDEDERYMLEAGYCVLQADGSPYRILEGWFKESLIMDFSTEEGRMWWFKKRKYLLDIGVDGFKTDGGEFVFGRDLRFADGRTGAEMRNLYPNDYIEAYYRFATEYHKVDALTFSRAGFTGAQNFPAHWAGDERSTFDAFRHSLIAGLTSGISGIPFWGWDLAGFNGDIPTVELFIRSAQMAAFCPIMQYHAESKGEYNQDRTPWNIAERTGDDRAIGGYRFYANLRMNLLPYIYDQARKTSETGIPLMRAMFVEYPEDERCHTIFDQYLFGDHLLVAPIIEEGMTERMVYFPKGKWIGLWSNEVIDGPAWKRVEASLLCIPVYVRSGTALLSNCDDSHKLGSWVGNSIEEYQVPVLRIYPDVFMDQTIEDHLNQTWKVTGTHRDDNYCLNIYVPQPCHILVNRHGFSSEDSIIINEKECKVMEYNADWLMIKQG